MVVMGCALLFGACARLFDLPAVGGDARGDALNNTIDATNTTDAPGPNCAALPLTCGPAANASCCESPLVTGGMFNRGYDVSGDGMFSDLSFPATVSNFHLDQYEVTVGRFRQFVVAGMGTQQSPPADGAGAHAAIAGSGWDTDFSSNLAPNSAQLIAALKCDSFETWTDEPGSNEDQPMDCITWYEAMAFCTWDGGYLPTEAEWHYAASGGSDQRAYPWSIPPSSLAIDCTYANYDIGAPAGAFCQNGTTGATNPVGSESTLGDGKWGQADLGGNMWEWVLDFNAAYPMPCDDCANLVTSENRSLRGGSFGNQAPSLRAAFRGMNGAANRNGVFPFGVRCARP